MRIDNYCKAAAADNDDSDNTTLVMTRDVHGSIFYDPTRPTMIASKVEFSKSGSSNYIRPRTRTKFGDKAFSVAGPVIWNSIPESIRAADNVHTFKRTKHTFFNLLN